MTFILHCENRNDGTEFGGSIYQKVNEKIETSINLAWTAGSNNTRFGIAAKYKLDCRTSLSVRMCCGVALVLYWPRDLTHVHLRQEISLPVLILPCWLLSDLWPQYSLT